MISRRQLLSLLGLNGAALVTPMAAGKKKRPEPQGFAAEQVWLDQWGCKRVILRQETSQRFKGMWVCCGGRWADKSWVEATAWRHWTYLGSLSDLGGPHD